MSWVAWLVFGAAIFAASTNAYYMVHYPNGVKFWLRCFNAIAVVYFGFIYLLLGMGVFDLPQLGPILIRPGIFVLLMLVAAEPIADYRR